MRRFNKVIISMLILFTFIVPLAIPMAQTAIKVHAATTTIKISNKSLTLEVGKTKALKMYGTKKKVTWTSSRKTVATVSSKGTVTAKAIGTATITASVSGKKYTCKVTVIKPKNPYLDKSPFKASETDIENINFVTPSDWKASIAEVTETGLVAYLAPDITSLDSNIKLAINLTNMKAPEYADAKAEFAKALTEATVNQQISKTYGKVSVTDFKQSDFKSTYFTALKTEYLIPLKDNPIKVIIYDFYLDNYQIEMTVTDAGDNGYQSIAEYMLKSIIVK